MINCKTKIALIILGAFFAVASLNLAFLYSLESEYISREVSSITSKNNQIWYNTKQSQQENFELSFKITGYRIISTDTEPLEFDENGYMFLVKNRNSFIDIEIITSKFGDYCFEDIPIRGHLIIDTTGEYFFSYNLDKPKNGFFMDIYFLSNNIQLSLAFNIEGYQICYEGFYYQGYEEIIPLYPHIFEPDQISEDSMRTSINKQDKLIIYNQEFTEKESSIDAGTLGFTFTNYGVSHECYDFGVSYPEELPDNYWEPYTSIDIGIYRLHPSEALVKSDLQTYNLDYVEGGRGFFRDMLAYCMGTHGGPHWEIWGFVRHCFLWWCWWEYERVGIIYPDEVEALWYHYYDPGTGIESDVYPYDTIIMSDSCYGYYKPPSTDPTMAKAFVDYGASAFVGATITVPAASDTYMRAFWNDLCQWNYNVRHATITLCNTYGQGWNLGDEWRIYGNSYATLP